jgi:hypothetical protein
MANKRTAISKKTRFEVFKRDSFKCQYCGSCAPDVVLNVDHIEPVSKGGDSSIMNLITSCFSCNSGKSDIRISDDSAIKKQKEQLDELNVKREQLQMMMQWRKELKSLDQEYIDIFCSHYHEKLAGWSLNDKGLETVKKLIKKFQLTILLDAIEKASEKLLFNDDFVVTKESASSFLNDISKIASYLSLPDHEQKLRYIRGIVRNRMYCNDATCMSLLKDAYQSGLSIEELTDIAKTSKHWTEFRGVLEGFIYG